MLREISQKLKIAAGICVTALALMVFGATFARAMWLSAPEDAEPRVTSAAAARSVAPDSPARLRIPAVGIDAHVQHVGRGATGNMAVPSNYSDAGWYRHGAKPGELGSAVIDGHVDNGFGLAGVFNRINEIRVGDDLYVDTADGSSLRFRVEQVAQYPYKDVPLPLVLERNDAARLNLITCSGDWLRGEKTYDKRIVVYAVLAE